MIKYTQTETGFKTMQGKRISYGNCLVTCIAAILEVQIAAVPNIQVFYGQKEKSLPPDWLTVLNMWLARRDLKLVVMEHEPLQQQVDYKEYFIARGESPRGTRHCIVMAKGLPAWDPHPSREGLTSIDHYYVLVKI